MVSMHARTHQIQYLGMSAQRSRKPAAKSSAVGYVSSTAFAMSMLGDSAAVAYAKAAKEARSRVIHLGKTMRRAPRIAKKASDCTINTQLVLCEAWNAV